MASYITAWQLINTNPIKVGVTYDKSINHLSYRMGLPTRTKIVRVYLASLMI